MDDPIEQARLIVEDGDVALLKQRWDTNLKKLSLPEKTLLINDCLESYYDESLHNEGMEFIISKTPKNCFLTTHVGGKLGRYPLSTACLNPFITLDIIKLIHKKEIKAVRTKVRTTPETGLLPLHAACLCGKARVDVVAFLISQYPEALEETYAEDFHFRKSGSYDHHWSHSLTPLQCACSVKSMKNIANTRRFVIVRNAPWAQVVPDVVQLLIQKTRPDADHSRTPSTVYLLLIAGFVLDAPIWAVVSSLVIQYPYQLHEGAMQLILDNSPPLDVFREIVGLKAPLLGSDNSDSGRFSAREFVMVIRGAIKKRLSKNHIQCLVQASQKCFLNSAALHYACIGPDKSLEVIQYLYEGNPSALHVYHKIDRFPSESPLHTLVYGNRYGEFSDGEEKERLQLEIIDYLVQADPSSLETPHEPKDNQLKVSPLQLAVDRGRPRELIDFLLTHSMEKTVREVAFSTKTHWLYEFLPDKFPEWSTWRDDEGNSLLHRIGKVYEDNGCIGTEELLKLVTPETGVVQNLEGNTPLHCYASTMCHAIHRLQRHHDEWFVRKLLQRCGKATSIFNKSGMLPVHLLSNQCNDKSDTTFATMFVEEYKASAGILDGAGKSLLHRACERNFQLLHIQCLLGCLKSAALIKDGNGVPLPFSVVHDEKMLILKHLLSLPESRKADRQTDLKGNTLVHAACMVTESRAVIKFLLKKKAFRGLVSVTNGNGSLPLHLLLGSQQCSDHASVSRVYQCFPRAVTVQDPLTGLYPFLRAAINPNASLDVIFMLFRMWPSLSPGYQGRLVDAPSRKRKLSTAAGSLVTNKRSGGGTT